jgi:hypothetical protein
MPRGGEGERMSEARDGATDGSGRRHSGAGVFPRLVGGLLVAAALWAGLLAEMDFRAARVSDLLAAATTTSSAERRVALLARVDEGLARGAPSAELADVAAGRALAGDPPDYDAAEAETWSALRRSPARSGSWSRLAYIDLARDGELGPEGLDALARSYEVEPFAAEGLRRWRMEFVLSRWRQMPESLRAAAITEARGSVQGQRWYEESVWLAQLADRLPREAGAAVRDVLPPLDGAAAAPAAG